MASNYNWTNPMQQMPYTSNPYNYLNHNTYPSSSSYQTQQQQFYSNNNNINNSQNNIIWVKGKENARSMQLPPNSTVVLLDSEVGKFYIKTTDDIGLGKLRIFSYMQEPDIDSLENTNTSRTNLDLSNYITREQFQEAIKEIRNNEQSIPIAESKSAGSKQKHTTNNKQF